MPLSLHRVDVLAERILYYAGEADDLAPGHTDYDFPLHPAELRLTYTRRNGGAWVLDSVDVIGHRPRVDETVNGSSGSRQRYHVEIDPFILTTEFGLHAPSWLRGFAWSHRDPDIEVPAAEVRPA